MCREFSLFFPGTSLPTVEGRQKVQKTLALIRPDAFRLKKVNFATTDNFKAGLFIATQMFIMLLQMKFWLRYKRQALK
jgi:hypothetical protein